MKTTLFAIALALAGGSCSSHGGPVAPGVTGSPDTAVVLTPDLQGVVFVPNQPGAQVYSWTNDQLLTYQFQLQNNTPQNFALQAKATFFDDAGVVVDDQGLTRHFFGPSQIQTISKTCSNSSGRKVKVQVSLVK